MGSPRMKQIVQPCIFGQFVPAYACKKSRMMKWLGKLFKGSTHKSSEGRCPEGFGGDDHIWHLPQSPMDGPSSKEETEELDHAIALSLSEDLTKPNGSNAQDEDEELARALQASIEMAPKQNLPSHSPLHSHLRGCRICAGCNHEIGYGRFLSCMGAVWHPHCFRCHACHQAISEREFSMSGNNPYHKACYKELHHPKCDVCHQFIPTNRAGLIEYRAHPFWQQRYCPTHEHDDTPRCCSCERMEPRDVQYISLEDGRKLCLECLDSSVMETGECQSLYHEIRDYYEGMNMRIDQQIPMLLVERQALNEAMEGEKDGHHHMPETRGLCLSEEQTVSSIFGRPRIGGNRVINMRTEPQKLTRRCEVTAILILYGLPRLLTGSILAHELMHGWLRLNGFRGLSPEVEEGICQVLSHMWLESEVTSGSSSEGASTSSGASSSSSSKKGGKSQMEKKLGDFFLHQIANDSSPAYGEGFRRGNAAMVQYGLRRTLDHIRLTGFFPL
ncbi:LIM domain-containing protein HDR3 isoform X1 [Cryptomeria japonica]|uniref:LIM domain-containing protein HDR3 isoform X1 n=2 Tax=Cryptomeria japonica TaxID=3369 RepID=UPI0025ACEB86|nr:LIM domain-containing protein HDR3 isoform X1 [Cryptomeria japonica]